MAVGEQLLRERRQRPVQRGAAPTNGRARRARHEAHRRKRVEMLADSRFAHAERGRQLARRRVRALEPVDDRALRVAEPLALDVVHQEEQYRK